MQGIRGAITIEENTREAIFAAVEHLVAEMCQRNALLPEAIGAALFSATEDITAAFPAAGARRVPGFTEVPLFDTRQMDVEESLDHCIRVLFLVNTEKQHQEIHHVYLGRASSLRPDLMKK